MKVHLRQIPAGGTLHIEGEEEAAPLGLEEAGAEPAGPLCYSLDVGLSGGGLFAVGSLRLRVRLRCVVTLDHFEHEIRIDAFAVQKELDGREVVDLTPEVREDIHLALPAHPRSAAAHAGIQSPITAPCGNREPGPWKALDQIKPQH
jgi:uncharacterized metal-binding protein YceD (DUF177 family)